MEATLVLKVQLVLMLLGYGLSSPCGSENLSCVDSQRRCFTHEMLCDDVIDCADGSDEGVNVTSFNCSGIQCSPEMFISTDFLCDGVANCENGEDETSVICADKCREPYRGGCAALNQTCATSASNAICRPCSPGFEYIPASGTCGATASVEFERDSYVVNENDGAVEVCLVLIGEYFQNITAFISITEVLDFHLVTSMVTFTGNSRSCVDIGLFDDSIALEEAESFSLTFIVPPGVEKGNISSSTVTILDDDVLIVQFNAETFVVGDSSEVAVCLKTNTGNAVELNINVTLFMEVEPNGNTTFTPATDTVTFPPSSSDGIECTSFVGLMNVSVDDILIVVFDLPPNSDAQKGLVNESTVVILEDRDETSRVTESPTVAATTNSTSDPGSDSAIVWGSVVGAVLIVLVILSVVFIVYCVRRKVRQPKVQEDGSAGKLEMHTVLPDDSHATTSLQYLDIPGDAPPKIVRETSHYVRPMTEAKLLIPGQHIELMDSIGKGEFGMVYRAILAGWEGRNDVVAVKTMRGMMLTQRDVEDMMKESVKMMDFNHPNVLNLIGVSIDAGESPHIVMPYMANGSLLSFLKKERPNLTVAEGADDEMVTEARKRLLSMCLQIAKGMEYLAAQRVVHRDLAARNCMMDINHVIKVADFGLSESMYCKNYFREGKEEGVKLPVKWMAIESFQDGIFTEKTDVWSFGVTCWEVFSLGKSPYPGVDPFTLVKALESGMRLETPYNAACSNQIYDKVLFHCWERNPEDRPTFTALVVTVSTLLEGIAGYMDFSVMPSGSSEATDDNQVKDTTEEPSSLTRLASLKILVEDEAI